jgi:hypothetical protein
MSLLPLGIPHFYSLMRSGGDISSLIDLKEYHFPKRCGTFPSPLGTGYVLHSIQSKGVHLLNQTLLTLIITTDVHRYSLNVHQNSFFILTVSVLIEPLPLLLQPFQKLLLGKA